MADAARVGTLEMTPVEMRFVRKAIEESRRGATGVRCDRLMDSAIAQPADRCSGIGKSGDRAHRS